jgi:hypothetical protein
VNERIRELAEQASLLYPQFGPGVDTRHQRKKRENIEKFAELIVRECVEQIQICSEQIKNDDGYADDNIWPIMQSIVDAVAIDVKEHFGVE